MSEPIVTNAESFCNELYSSVQKRNPQGKITAGDLMLAVEKLNFDTGDLKNKALATLRDAAVFSKVGYRTVLDSRKVTIQLIAKLYEEASRSANKTDLMTALGAVLTKEAGISPTTREVVKVATNRFERLEIGKSYAEAGLRETIQDRWTRMKTKILEILTYIRHLPSYSQKKIVEQNIATYQKACSKIRSGDYVTSFLYDVSDLIWCLKGDLQWYLGIEKQEDRLPALEQRLIKLKICTQEQIDKGILLTSYDVVMRRLQKKDPALYAYLSVSRELTMFVTEPELYMPEQREKAIERFQTEWSKESDQEEILNDIIKELTFGASMLASNFPRHATGWFWKSVALTDLMEKMKTEDSFPRTAYSKGDLSLNELLMHRDNLKEALTKYFNQHPLQQ